MVRLHLVALMVLAADAFHQPVTMGLRPRFMKRPRSPRASPSVASGDGSPEMAKPRWRRVVKRTAKAAGAFVVLAPKAALASPLVAPAVVEAARAARAAVEPGSLRDRIITDHITLLTTVLREQQIAKFRAMRNLIGTGAAIAVVFGLFIRISTRNAEARLREQEIEMFGEYRDASTIIADDEDDEDDEDDDKKKK